MGAYIQSASQLRKDYLATALEETGIDFSADDPDHEQELEALCGALRDAGAGEHASAIEKFLRSGVDDPVRIRSEDPAEIDPLFRKAIRRYA